MHLFMTAHLDHSVKTETLKQLETEITQIGFANRFSRIPATHYMQKCVAEHG